MHNGDGGVLLYEQKCSGQAHNVAAAQYDSSATLDRDVVASQDFNASLRDRDNCRIKRTSTANRKCDGTTAHVDGVAGQHSNASLRDIEMTVTCSGAQAPEDQALLQQQRQ